MKGEGAGPESSHYGGRGGSPESSHDGAAGPETYYNGGLVQHPFTMDNTMCANIIQTLIFSMYQGIPTYR